VVIAAALALPRGGPGAALVVLVCVFVAMIVASLVADPSDQRWVLLFALVAITGREALMSGIDVILLSRGLRFYAPDEHVYLDHGYWLWQWWNGHPMSPEALDVYLRSWYVHWIARLYQLFGEDLTIVKAINTLLGVVACLFGYRIMRNLGMPGARWALVVLLAFPSIVLWTALAMKDAWVIFFLFASAFAASEFIARRSWPWLAAAIVVLTPLRTVRLYMLVIGALALLAVPFGFVRWRDRLKSAGVLAAVYVFFAIIQPFSDLPSNPFYLPIFLREVGAQAARSSFVDPAPVIQGQPGDRFQVQVTSGATASPGTTPEVVFVEPGTRIVVATGSAWPTPSAAASSIRTPAVVRPGDIVVIVSPKPNGAPTASAAATTAPATSTPGPSLTPTATPRVVVVEPEAKNIVGLSSEVDPDQSSVSGSLTTNLKHLPIGASYTLLAPFPWTARTLEQIATIPEMLTWYVCLVAAVIGFLYLLRRRDTRYAYGIAAIIGLTIVLSLISANVGTLVRSRAMLVPYVVLLSAVGFDAVLRRYPAIRARAPWLWWPEDGDQSVRSGS